MNQKLNSRAEEMDVSLRVFTFRENSMFLEGFYFPTLSRFYSTYISPCGFGKVCNFYRFISTFCYVVELVLFLFVYEYSFAVYRFYATDTWFLWSPLSCLGLSFNMFVLFLLQCGQQVSDLYQLVSGSDSWYKAIF